MSTKVKETKNYFEVRFIDEDEGAGEEVVFKALKCRPTQIQISTWDGTNEIFFNASQEQIDAIIVAINKARGCI